MRRKFFLWVAVAISLIAVQMPALADEAREFHKNGVEFFKAEKYEKAAEAFREAHRLRPTWKLFYNIGQCEAAAKRYGLALEAFEAYLVEGGDEVPDDRREYVSAEIRRIQPLVGSLEVEAESGLEVLVDGQNRATTPLSGPLRVSSGKHKVVLRKSGKPVFETAVNVAGGMATKVTIEAEPDEEPVEQLEEPEVSVPEPAPPEPEGRPALKKAGWILTGTGAAILIGGAITGITALSKNNELADNCPEPDNCDQQYEDLGESAQNLALVTDIVLGVGGVAVATGVVLLLVSRKNRLGEENSANVSIVPTVGLGSTGLSISGRF